MKEFDPEELSRCSGKDGAPSYISHGGKIYDVSGSKLWKSGTHMARHNAGRELDNEIAAAPHGPEVLERVPKVGVLRISRPQPDEVTGFSLLERYPFLKRHPHPSTVHFPIALLTAALAFEAVFLFSGLSSFRTSSLHCLALGFISLPFAIVTGYLTWRINYLARPMRPVRIKVTLSWVLLAISLITMWRMWSGAARVQAGVPYLVSLLVMAVLVSVTGYFGGQLTFPIEKRKKDSGPVMGG